MGCCGRRYRVLLVSRRIAGNFAQFEMVLRVGGLQQHNAVLCFELVFHALQSFFCLPSSTPISAMTHMPCGSMKILPSSHSLAPLFRQMHRKHAGTTAVPTCSQYCMFHLFNLFAYGSFFVVACAGKNFCILFAVFDKHTGDEHGLGYRTLGRSCRLEAFARLCEKQFRFRQSFQSARPISGSPCGPRWVR